MYTINIEIHVIIYMWQISCVKAHNLTACIQHQHNLLLLLVLSISWTDISVGLHPYDCQSKKKMLKHIIYIWSRSAMSIKIKWVGSPTHNLTACIEHNLLLLLVLSLSWADISVGLHPYDWQPKQKMLKHIIYIWSRSAMSIKWVGSPNLNLTAWIQHNLLLLLMLVLSLS